MTIDELFFSYLALTHMREQAEIGEDISRVIELRMKIEEEFVRHISADMDIDALVKHIADKLDGRMN